MGPVDFRELTPSESIVIGSSIACGLRLDSPSVAGMHCTLSLVESPGQLPRVKVEDWDTEEGTYVEDFRIGREHIAEIGQTIRIGEFHVLTEQIKSADRPVFRISTD